MMAESFDAVLEDAGGDVVRFEEALQPVAGGLVEVDGRAEAVVPQAPLPELLRVEAHLLDLGVHAGVRVVDAEREERLAVDEEGAVVVYDRLRLARGAYLEAGGRCRLDRLGGALSGLLQKRVDAVASGGQGLFERERDPQLARDVVRRQFLFKCGDLVGGGVEDR